MSTDISKVIVFGEEFQDALKAAHAVAPNTEHDMVQLRIQAHGGHLMVAARDPKNNLIIGVTVGTTMVDIVAERDEVLEISKASARQIMGMKVTSGDDDEDPMLGLLIAGDRISITDETGFDLGLRLSRVRRLHFDAGPWLGDVAKMLARAADSLPAETVHLSPVQWKKIAAVAQATGLELEVRPLQPSGGVGMSRALIVGDRCAGYVSHFPVGPGDDRPGGDTPDPEPLNFDDGDIPEDVPGGELGEKITHLADRLKSRGVTVLPAAPPKGIA